MFESQMSVIAVNTANETVRFFIPGALGENGNMVGNYKARPFDDEFFEKLGKGFKAYKLKNPAAELSKVSFVLPDHVFLIDTVKIPALNKKAMGSSLDLAIGATYKNKAELNYRTFPLLSNKQFSIYGMVGVRKDILERLKKVCSENGIDIQNITFAANATANAALALNSKLKNATFLLLDIKENEARYVFVNKGRTIGYYSLPFGYSMLYRSRFAAEDLLFNHESAELLVLNAQEKAKAKQITMMGEEIIADPDAQLSETLSEEENEEQETPLFFEGEQNSKKEARKLPKFMLRETPSDRDGFIYENFRLFMKWTLDLLANNSEIVSLGAIDTVYVNMPSEYDFLYERIAREEEENKVKFAPLITSPVSDPLFENAGGLDIYGALFINTYNKMNNF